MVLSSKNKRDVDEIEKHYLKGLTFHYVSTVDDVLKVELLKDQVETPMKFAFADQKIAV